MLYKILVNSVTTLEYQVEADSEEKALELAQNGEGYYDCEDGPEDWENADISEAEED